MHDLSETCQLFQKDPVSITTLTKVQIPPTEIQSARRYSEVCLRSLFVCYISIATTKKKKSEFEKHHTCSFWENLTGYLDQLILMFFLNQFHFPVD